MKLFLAAEPFERVGMDLVHSFKKPARRGIFTLVKTDGLTKVQRCFPLWNAAAAAVSAVFAGYRAYVYGTSQNIRTDNGKHLTAKVVDSVRGIPGSKKYVATAYRPQTNEQAERSVKTIVLQLLQYVAVFRKDQDQYLQPRA